jgi:hypothetical protein
MPKLPIPEKLQKSMFWITIGVLALFAVIIWWLGTSAVAQSRDENISKIDSWFVLVQGTNPIANTSTVEAKKKQAVTRTASMTDAWERVFANQMKEPFWPEVQLDGNGAVIKPGLPKEFVEAAKKADMKAAEWIKAIGSNALQEPLSEAHKEIYRNYAKNQIAHLCAIVKSEPRIVERRAAAAAPAANTRAEAVDAPQPGEICVWPTASQQVAAEMLTFPEGNPPTQDIIYAQANVWVYQSLFNIIRLTNESIKESTPPKDLAHYNAPVKMIHEVLIGERFPVKEEEGARPGAVSNPDEEQTTIPPQLLVAAQRYVNEHGKRLKGEELLALADPTLNLSPTPAQYKLMPVYMRLEVDQRFLGRLLAECANSPLTVEVKDVTFKVDGHADRAAATTPDAPAGQGGEQKQNKNFYDMTVEITGHIYIYFPPAAATPAATEEAPAEEATPADATAQAGG